MQNDAKGNFLKQDFRAERRPAQTAKELCAVDSQTACAKAIIAGEHAVVYGAKAVAMPLSELRMRIDLAEDADSTNHYIKIGDTPISHLIYDVIRDALDLLGLKERGLMINGYSKVPIGAGLGSSATLCVALLKGLAHRFGISLSHRDLSQMGNELERRFHGNPSGLDTAVVAYEKCIVFTKNLVTDAPMIDPLDIPTGRWHFALIDSGVRASTKSMVAKAKPYFMAASGDRLIGKFNEVTDDIVHGLCAVDFPLVSHSITEACHLLDRVGVVTERLWDIIHRCHELGIPAAKPTGAGGGGAILALCDSERYLDQLSRLRQTFGVGKVFSASI